MPPARLVERLNSVFTEFDQLARELGIEKIKTIGDAYMAAAGLPQPRADHADAMAELALGMLDAWSRAEPRPARAVPGPHRDAHAARSWQASSAATNSSTMSGATR